MQLSLTFIQDELAFDDMPHLTTFLTTHRAAFYQNPNASDNDKILDCKAAQSSLAQSYEEKYRKATIRGAI